MTFQYNGTNIPVNGQNAPAASVHNQGVLERFRQKPLRILVGAVVAFCLLYFCNRFLLNQVLVFSAFYFLQALIGEVRQGAHSRRNAVAEAKTPVRSWLKHFALVELPSLLLSFIEMFLLTALGVIGM